MILSYERYLDKVLGGWIGKSLGGTIGARFEGDKRWIEVEAKNLFPDEIPPNDDLDLQVVWLKVLEEKGAALTGDDLAKSWLKNCWYPFNEYGNFRRNYRLGINPPYSGTYNNEFYSTGMGCPIRSEIWGYVFPGAPHLAARYAEIDGTLDHDIESVSAEKFQSAMSAMAFFVSDIRTLIDMNLHYLPEECEMRRLVVAAIQAFDEGLNLNEARTRLLLLRGHPEACDSLLNVPFTILGLLYGNGDLERTLVEALKCGYDTDCTLATSGALVGQLLGASAIPPEWKERIGDDLVMGIQYNRKEMTLSALARDTVRIGTLLAGDVNNAVKIEDAPSLKPLPIVKPNPFSITVDYLSDPVAAPGETVAIRVTVTSTNDSLDGLIVSITPPRTFTIHPTEIHIPPDAGNRSEHTFYLTAREDVRALPQKNIFRAVVKKGTAKLTECRFGVEGAMLWRVLGAYFDAISPKQAPPKDIAPIDLERGSVNWRPWTHYYVALNRNYINEQRPNIAKLYTECSRYLGRNAVLAQKGMRIRPEEIIGIQGEYCIYLYQELMSPEMRKVYIMVGNNDAYRIYLNRKVVAERNEQTRWSPRNDFYIVTLKKGINRILLKLLRRGSALDFSLGIKEYGKALHFNAYDWHTDLASVNPLKMTK